MPTSLVNKQLAESRKLLSHGAHAHAHIPHLARNTTVPYTTKGHSIVLFEARSTKSWEDLRQKLTGTTDPKEATEGSIRNLFLKKVSHDLL